MVLASLAGPWITDLLSDTQEDVNERTVDISEASELGLEVVSTSYNRESDNLSVVVRNNGNEEINDETNISVNVLGDSYAKSTEYSSVLDTKEIKTYEIPVGKAQNVNQLEVSLTDYPVNNEREVQEYSNDWWWNNSWSYRAPVYVENSVNRDLEGFQVKFELDTAELVSRGFLNSDCSDLRFSSYENDRKFDYWIKEGCNTESTEIIVRIPEIDGSSTEKFFVFAGNSNVESESSPEKTMFIYDLHGSGYDGELRWDAIYNSSEEFVEFSDPDGGSGGLFYEKLPEPGFKANFEYFAGGGSGADATFLAAYVDEPVSRERKYDKGGYRYALDEYNGNSLQLNYEGETKFSESAGFDIDDSTWRSVEIEFNGDNQHRINANNNLYINETVDENLESTGNYFGWGGRTGGSKNYHRVRELTVRKYIEPVPKVRVGDWESRN